MFPTSPETVFTIGGFSLSNSMLTALLVSGSICLLAILASGSIKYIPGKFQGIIELIIGELYNLTSGIAGKSKAKIFFPWVATFFFLILLENWIGLLPFVGTITIKDSAGHLVPLFRSTNTDLNSTLALALISTIMTQFYGIKYLGIIGYLKRFFGLSPIHQFSGIIELISEVAKILTLSFRLFGNIFAGDTLIGLASGITTFLIPIPFIMFELFVGLVQAIVFMILTLTFMAIMSTKPVD